MDAKLPNSMSTNPRNVLLTGGAGFIGSHLAEALLRKGSHLSIVDDLNDFYSPERKKENLEQIRQVGEFEFFLADICDNSRLREIFERVRPNVIIHLAARAGVRPSLEDPRLYERVNIAGTFNLLELCREFEVPKFIFGSSRDYLSRSRIQN